MLPLTAATVDEYLQLLPEAQRRCLEKLRQAIRSAAPGAEEVISYHIPTYKQQGALVHFAAFKNHLSFFGVNKALVKEFEEELKDFRVVGTTIHFSPEKPLPLALVRKIVRRRVKENQGLRSRKRP